MVLPKCLKDKYLLHPVLYMLLAGTLTVIICMLVGLCVGAALEFRWGDMGFEKKLFEAVNSDIPYDAIDNPDILDVSMLGLTEDEMFKLKALDDHGDVSDVLGKKYDGYKSIYKSSLGFNDFCRSAFKSNGALYGCFAGALGGLAISGCMYSEWNVKKTKPIEGEEQKIIEKDVMWNTYEYAKKAYNNENLGQPDGLTSVQRQRVEAAKSSIRDMLVWLGIIAALCVLTPTLGFGTIVIASLSVSGVIGLFCWVCWLLDGIKWGTKDRRRLVHESLESFNLAACAGLFVVVLIVLYQYAKRAQTKRNLDRARPQIRLEEIVIEH